MKKEIDMTDDKKFSVGSFVLLFSVLSIIACVGFLYKIHTGIVLSPRCIEATASAEKTVLADTATWRINFEKASTDQTELNKLILADKAIVQNFFEENEIETEDMEFSSFIRENYSDTKKANKPSFCAGYNLTIKSKDVEKILSLRDNLSKLYEQGIIIKSNHIDFQCSNIEDVKIQLSIEAATKAYEKAKNITHALHAKVRRIHKVYDTDFQIEGRNYYAKSFGVFNAMDGNDSSESQPIPKRKISAFVKVEVEI